MFFVYIKPTYSVISERKIKYEEYQNVLNKVKEIKAKRDQLSSAYANISQEDLDKLNKMIPEKFVSEYFINDVNALAARYGMSVDKMEINIPAPVEASPDGVEQPQGRFLTITAKFTLNGRYDQFVSFLKDMESSLRLIDVVGIKVSNSQVISRTGQEQKDNDILNYSVEVLTYSIR